MKKTILKVLASMLVLAMAITAFVIPNTEASAATEYYIAGNMQGWNAKDANWKMTQSGSNYVYTFTGLEVGKAYEFKVTAGNWNSCWPSSNYSFSLASAGDVTVTFNPTSKAITLSGPGLAEKAPYYVAGNMNDWTPGHADYGMTKSGTDYIYELTVEAGKTYEFKVTDGTWNNAWPGSNYSFTTYTAGKVTIKFSSSKNVTVSGDPLTPPAVVNYFVTGDFADWAVDNDAYKMTKSGSDYVLKKTLPAGKYSFQITNGTWDVKFPSSDSFAFEVTEECEVTFKLSNNAASVSGTNVYKSYYIRGTMTGENWDINEDYRMKKTETGYEWSGVMAAGSYSFKVGNKDWSEGYPGSDQSFTVTAESTVTIKMDASNNVTVDIVPVQTEEPEDPKDPVEPEKPVDKYTIKVQVPAEWTSANWYAWDENNNNAAPWPGTALGEAVDGWYTIELPVTMTNLIINYNGGQTKDIKNIDPTKPVWVTVTGTGDDGFAVSYEAPSIDNTGDFSMVLPLVLVLFGGAAVIVASKKRFA